MDDDDLTPAEFRARMVAGEPATINPGPRPTVIEGLNAGVRITSGGGGGVSIAAPAPAVRSGLVPALSA